MNSAGIEVSNYKLTKLVKKKKSFFLSDISPYLLLLPSFILVFLFCYIPLYGVLIAFEDFSPFKGVFKSAWVGFKHFEFFFADVNFWRVMVNTLTINFLSLVWGFPLPVIFALFLNEVTKTRIKKLVQTISYLPHFLSWVVVSGIVITILSPTDGIVNIILNNLFGIDKIYFLGESRYFRSIVVTAGIWKTLGMASVYYLAAISSIDSQLYEACIIDGGGRIRQMWHITLPGIRTMISILLILQIGSMVSIGFENIFLLYNPLVYEVGDVISTYTYRLGLERMEYSLTTAIGFTQSVVNIILVSTANSISKRVSNWSLW